MEPTLGWGNEQNKKYYEAETQKKVIYVPNLSFFLHTLNIQVLKLPHEMRDPNTQAPSGTTHGEIIQSFCDGVDVLFAVIAPVRKQYKDEMDSRSEVWKDCDIQIKDFKTALDKLAWIYQLLDDVDMLNSRVITMDLPDIEDIYDRDLVLEDENEKHVGALPPSVPASDDEAVGKVEGKVKRPVASPGLE